MLFQFKQKIAQSLEGFEAQADKFLAKNGFVVDAAHRKLFAAFVQHLPEHQDFFYPKILAACMRKARANENAFFTMYPDHKDHPKNKAKEVNEVEVTDVAPKVAVGEKA